MPYPPTRAPATAISGRALEVTGIRALRGPNYWRLAPVIACDVRLGPLEQVTSADLPGLTDRLLAVLPGLREHPCSRQRAGGFVERLVEGTGWPHILEHVALELQTVAGSDVEFGRVVPSGDPGVWWVIVAYEEEEVGVEAVRRGAALVRACIDGEPVDAPALIGAMGELYEDVRLGPTTGMLAEEARRRGIPVRRLGPGSLVQLGLGRHLRRIRSTLTEQTSILGVDIAQDKDLTKRVLANIGLAVPPGAVAHDVGRAVAAAEEIGFPVILKPLTGNHGRGISGRLTNAEAVREAWARAAPRYSTLVVERYVEGRDHRVLVVAGKLVAVAERLPAHVLGDGRATIRELIDAANRDPRRGRGHTRILTLIPVDDATVEYLAEQGATLETVPAAGERVVLRATANLSTGGTAIDRTDEIHPDNVTACEMAAGVIGLDVAGLDVLTPDIGVPFHENGAVIIEVNAAPGIRMHTHPTEGKPRNVPGAILDTLYPPGSRATIPIIAVTGTNGKTTTTRLIAHLFRGAGRMVGFTTTDGVYLGSRLVVQGDMSGPFAANIVLSNPAVDLAVLETARGGILRAGLGFDECDVGVVLNVAEDHLGLRGIHTLEQLAEVKSVIPAVVKRRGYAVLNADDPLVYAMAERTRGDVVLFSTLPDAGNPIVGEHLEAGGIAACVENDDFVIRRGRLTIPIAAAADVPLTFQGAARFQYGNVLAAIAAAYVQGMRYEDIRAGLLSFVPSSALTPGRLNLLRAPRGMVLVDYAHNAAALRGLVEFARRLPADRRIAVVAAPGDRRDEDLRAVGRVCAVFDHVIVKEDADSRGRARGDVVRLVVEGLREGGLAAERIDCIPDEPTAVARGVELMRGHDLLVVLAVDVPAVLGQLRPICRAG